MKTSVLITGLALAAAMAVQAVAQEPPSGPPPTPNPQMRQQFEATHKQMEQIHAQERAQVLGALTPANRQLLATIAGQLATSTTPDYTGAARRLDAALSSSEKQAIVSASQTARQQMNSAMMRMRQQMGRPPMGMMGPGGGPPGAQRTLTAGEILLRVAMNSMWRMHP